MASSASAVETRSSPSIIPIKERLEAYLKAFNRREPAEYCKFYAEDIHVHIPAFPPINSRTELEALFRQGLAFFSETIRPTVFIVGEKEIAMEAMMESVAVEDIDFKFPFTGEKYKKGEEFVYEIVYVLMDFLFFCFLFCLCADLLLLLLLPHLYLSPSVWLHVCALIL